MATRNSASATAKKSAAKKVAAPAKKTAPPKKQKPKVRVVHDPTGTAEAEANALAAMVNNTDTRHERGVPVAQSKKRPTPASENAYGNRNPSPSTRLKPGQNSGKARAPTPRYVLTNAERQQMAKEAGLTPLEFLVSMMLDEREKLYVRYDAAKAAAPYFHRKMPIGIDNGAGGPLGLYSKEQLAKLTLEDLVHLESIMAKMADVPMVAVGVQAGPGEFIKAVQDASEDS